MNDDPNDLIPFDNWLNEDQAQWRFWKLAFIFLFKSKTEDYFKSCDVTWSPKKFQEAQKKARKAYILFKCSNV